MNIDLIGGNWYLARAVLMLATFAAFALFVALVRFIQKRSERRARDAAREDADATRTPRNWSAPTSGRDPPVERRAA
ncbi:MAG TPA: hypothetical protein VMN56_16840 [Casimicrobiaceae bacterium]|nr:hypothetical protein [Casimicrobiaceae bacterium]